MGAEYLFAFVVLLGLILAAQSWLEAHGLWRWVYAVTGPTFGLALQVSGEQIRAYEPPTLHDAKIANEKIKLAAVTLNTIALGVVAVGVVVPSLSELRFPVADLGVLLAAAFAFYIHVIARRYLNYLKDEKAAETRESSAQTAS